MVVVVAFIKMIQLTNIWKVWSSLCDFRLPLFLHCFSKIKKKERKKKEDGGYQVQIFKKKRRKEGNLDRCAPVR
jgi:hypothetical protein